MVGLGTIINVAAVLAGGLMGRFFGKVMNTRLEETLERTCGVSVLFLGIAGALEGMLRIENNSVISQHAIFVVVILLLGALIGEIINFEGMLERFGEWLKIKTGNAKDKNFVEGFLTATFTVCIGAMAIVGSIEDGINGDYTVLATKSILDCIIVMVMTGTMGKGPIFSFIPIAILQGGVTLLARFIQPVLTDASMGNLSMIGSILIFCVGINLVWGKKIKVANLLPAVVLAVVAAFVPINW